MPYRTSRPCPGCGGGLDSRRGEGFSYDNCAACGGVWISWVMLMRLANEIEPGYELTIVGVAGRSSRLCPDCRLALSHASVFEIPIDGCIEREHGVYLDKGELIPLLVGIAQERDLPAPLKSEERHIHLPALSVARDKGPGGRFRSILVRLFG